MSAQPADAHGPAERPRTLRAIRTRLTDEQRERFDAALADTDEKDVLQVMRTWAALAQANTVPGLEATHAAVRAGRVDTHDIDDVFAEASAR
jgi:hypothetical protein